MKMSNNLYNILKWIVITVSPALCAMITGFGVLYGFDSAIIVGTISLITTFVGAIIGISSINYSKKVGENLEE